MIAHKVKFKHAGTNGESSFDMTQTIERKHRLSVLGVQRILSNLGYRQPRVIEIARVALVNGCRVKLP